VDVALDGYLTGGVRAQDPRNRDTYQMGGSRVSVGDRS